MLVSVHRVGTEGEDQVCADIAAFGIADVLGADDGTDQLLRVGPVFIFVQAGQVVFHGLAGSASALNGLGADIGSMAAGVCDLKGVVVHILAGDPVFKTVDGRLLGIAQVDVAGQAVSGDVVGRVEAAGRDRVGQVDPEQVIGRQFSVFLYLFPVIEQGAVFNDSVLFHGMVIDSCILIQDGIEIQGVKRRDVGVRRRGLCCVAGGFGLCICFVCGSCTGIAFRAVGSPGSILIIFSVLTSFFFIGFFIISFFLIICIFRGFLVVIFRICGFCLLTGFFFRIFINFVIQSLLVFVQVRCFRICGILAHSVLALSILIRRSCVRFRTRTLRILHGLITCLAGLRFVALCRVSFGGRAFSAPLNVLIVLTAGQCPVLHGCFLRNGFHIRLLIGFLIRLLNRLLVSFLIGFLIGLLIGLLIKLLRGLRVRKDGLFGKVRIPVLSAVEAVSAGLRIDKFHAAGKIVPAFEFIPAEVISAKILASGILIKLASDLVSRAEVIFLPIKNISALVISSEIPLAGFISSALRADRSGTDDSFSIGKTGIRSPCVVLIALWSVCMDLFAAYQDLFITGFVVVVAPGLLKSADQLPVFLIALAVMNMFSFRADQVSFLIITAVFRTVLMLRDPTGEHLLHPEAVLCMDMAVCLLLRAGQLQLIAGIVMLVGFYTTLRFLFHGDGRKDQRVGRHKHDKSRHDTDSS